METSAVATTPAELAEDTAVHLLPRPGFEVLDRGDLVLEATPYRCAVHRVRLGDVDAAVGWARGETRRHGATRLEWWVGWNAAPSDLAAQLERHGLVPDEEEATLTGMTCGTEPPSSPVEVRRIETLEHMLEAVAVDWDVWGMGEEERRRRTVTERGRFDPNGTVHHFAAYVDGRPVGFGRAIDMVDGVAMMGGAVLPEVRGRGVYRALVHARWQHAAARGTPLLVTQAGHMSEPVLARLGFRAHGVLHLYMDPAVASGHGDD
jgi:GNAT superfamily N-acetyltransferase